MEKVERESSSLGVKLVPWMSWDEWLFVYHSLFSHSPLSVASALTKISTWRSRGCVPVTVEVTASIIEIQLRDPQLRKDRIVGASEENQASDFSDNLLSEEMLAMLYCMAIMRLVNGVVEKTRNQREVSIAMAADAIGLPRMLIDVRHEGSHRELPALQVVRDAAAKAIDWLLSYYWEPQKKAIPFQGDSTVKIRKGIESKVHELVFCLKAKETPQSSSPSPSKGKRKKKYTSILKSLVKLYSSCSSEVVSVLLDFLVNALNSPISSEASEKSVANPSTDSLLEDWKPVVKVLLQKDPEVIVALLKEILNVIEVQENMKYETGRQNLESPEKTEVQQVENLSSLFTWLIRNIKQSKPRQSNDSLTIPKPILTQLLRKCLMLSAVGNKPLMNSTFHIAQMIGEDHLMKKLTKLSSVVSSNLEIINRDKSSLTDSKHESISQAAKNLALIKTLRRKRKASEITMEVETVGPRRWVVAESWNPCPIGMLPNSAGSSGCLPVLDRGDVLNKSSETLSPKRRITDISGEEISEPGDISETLKDYSISTGINGKLMIGGVWSEIGEEDLLAIKSSIRVLV